ncbi:hypothetical protein K4K52_007523 [Colletotrichum sp. SAR 10_76]|nr:hypothetical protein K4K52_007523 [Colletotrichum sp. SAR 10_76]
MNPPAIPVPTPTAQMPLMAGAKAKLLHSLNQGDSLYALSLHFGEVVDELKRMARPPTKTIMVFTMDPNQDWRMHCLLQAIPPKLLKSIISGTVAYDSAHTNIEDYGTVGPGVYVIGISVKRTRSNAEPGAWLSWAEIQQLISKLEEYIKAYEVLRDVAPASRTTAQRGSVGLATHVDMAFGGPRKAGRTATSLAFVEGDRDAEDVRIFIDNLKKRRPPNLTPANIHTPQHQSPLYVGCSDDVKTRLKGYTLQKRFSLNKLLALTLSVMQQMGLDPKMTKKVVLRTWEAGQLPVAEALVITLARSSFYMEGFNKAEGGGQPGKAPAKALLLGKHEVMLDTHFRGNLENSNEDLLTRAEFIESRSVIIQYVTEMEVAVNRLQQSAPGRGALVTMINAKKRELEGRLKAAQERHEQLAELHRIMVSIRDWQRGQSREE